MDLKVKHSDILKTDWDIIIILDACRYDMFKEVIGNKFFGSIVHKADSEASYTAAWFRKHFINSTRYKDVIYISGNPQVNSYGVNLKTADVFFDVYNSWETEENNFRVREDALYVYKNYENRMIIHFLPPHYPYLFDSKKFNPFNLIYKVFPSSILKKINRIFIKNNKNKFKLNKNARPISRIEETYKLVYTNKQIKDAYKRNLLNGLVHVAYIITHIKNKKIIITSDHAEYLGENGRYGHGGVRTELITTVPYVVIEV